MRKRTKMQIAKLCIMSMAISTLAGISMGNKAYADTWPDIDGAKIKSAQPHFSGYTVRNIETWDKETDPYSDLMRARVPLQKRNEAFTATQANPRLNDKTEIMLMQGDYGNSFFNSTIANNAYGNVAFNFWQYTDYFCPWHGAATVGTPSELYDPTTNHWRARGFEFGIVNIPNQAYINAAHKNGVKAIACVYFDPHFRPGQTINEMFVKDTNGDYIVAKKLIALAKEYGIDGYFLNNEEHYDERFKDFMSYLSANGMYTQFYDTNSSFNESKAQHLKDDKHEKIHDSVFVNYGWGDVNKFVELANKIKVDPYKAVFLGIEANQGRYAKHHNSLVKDSYASAEDKNPLCSIALFTPSDMYQRGLDEIGKNFTLDSQFPIHQRNEYQWMIAERERMYFSGVTCDPKDTGSHEGYKREDVGVNNASYWPGVADFKAETSVIRGKKFYSDFNIGKGMQYFVNGKVANDEPWTNLNDQDILPSWQWWFESSKSKLKADFDFGEKEVRNDVYGKPAVLPFKQIGAYNGGSSIAVYGKLDAKNTLRLFKTDLEATDSTKAKIAFRKTSEDTAKMKLGLIFEDKPAETVEVELKDTEAKSDSFKMAEADLSKYAGKKIAAIGLVFDGNADNYQMNIGSISVSDTEAETEAPAGFDIERIYADKQMVLKWNIDSYDNVDKYRVYAESDGKKHFLGGIYDEKLYVKNYYFDKGKNVKFTLVKVGKDGKESKAAEKTVDFSKLPTDINVEEITPTGEFEVSVTNSSGSYDIQKKTISLPKENKSSGKVEFSFVKGSNGGAEYEAIVEPIKDYTDDKMEAQYKAAVTGDKGVVNVADIKDGNAYDLTIKPKNSDIGISYRGKFNDSYAKPMTEDDVAWGGKQMIALRSPLTRDWYELKVEFQKDGETNKTVVETYKRGVTPNYHSPFTLPADKGEIILNLKDYKGNSSEFRLKYDEAYKAELLKLRDEYLSIVNNRNLAKTLFTNDNLDAILDELKLKLDEVDGVVATLKRNEEKVNTLVKEIKDIYGKLIPNANIVKYDFKLILPVNKYMQIAFELKDDKGEDLDPVSTGNYVYSYVLTKGKKYNYSVSSFGWGSQIMPVKGSVEVNEAGSMEIKLERAAQSIKVKAKGDGTVKRLGTIDKNDYMVEVNYSYYDKENLPLSDAKFTVEDIDTSALGEQVLKVSGLNKTDEFKVMVVPNDTDPAELKELWEEIKTARGLKEKAEYKYATKEKKEAFDEAFAAAEALITGSTFDVDVIREKLEALKEAVKALDGLSNQPLAATPSAKESVYKNYYVENMVDGDESTFAWFGAEQAIGDWIKLTYPKQIKVKKVKIVYPEKVKGDFIRRADIEVKDGENWKKVGEIAGTEITEVEIAAGEEPVTTEVQVKITEAHKNWYKIAEFQVEYEAADTPNPPQPQPDPEIEALKKTLNDEIEKAEAIKNDVKYKNADKDKKEEFDEALEAAINTLKDDAEKEDLEESINQLKAAMEALNGKEEVKPNPPTITYPTVPAVPVVPEKEVTTEEQPRPDVKPEPKPNENEQVQEIKPDATPQGEAVEKKVFTLPSSKKTIGFNALKGKLEAATKEVIFPQNKTKINASVTSKALSELIAKQISKFEIKGKNFTLYLNAKNLKALSKLTKKNITFKAVRLKNGKIKLQVFADGKKLTAKQLAKLKIKVK